MKIFDFIDRSIDDEIAYYLEFFQFSIAKDAGALDRKCIFQLFYNYYPDSFYDQSPWLRFDFGILSSDNIFWFGICFKPIFIGFSFFTFSESPQ